MSTHLWRFWRDRGHLSEGRRWLGAALAAADTVSEADRARALVAGAVLASEQADYPQAKAALAQSRVIYTRLGDTAGLAQVANRLGNIALDSEDYSGAMHFHETGLMLFRQLGDRFGIASSLSSLGEVAHRTGEHTRATALFEEQLVLFRTLGNTPGVAWALRSLAYLALERDDRATAAVYFREALALFAAEANPRGITHCLVGFAALAGAAGDWTRAAQLLGAVEASLQALRTRLGPVDRAVYERTETAAQAALDRRDWRTASAAGAALSPESAVALALAGTN
jgi:non-specific serine/threonine protein kinase